MSIQPLILDKLELVTQSDGDKEFRRQIAAHDLPRLMPLLAGDTASELQLYWRTWAESDQFNSGRRGIDCSIQGVLQLQCQRCLQPVQSRLDVERRYLFVEPGAELDDSELEDEECDAVELTEQFDLIALAEDEILLSLPVAPRHSQCQLLGVVADSKPNPFAVLAALKKN